MKTYKVKLIKEYTKMANNKEEAIEGAKFEFDNSNDSSFCQEWDKVQCKELKKVRAKNEQKHKEDGFLR